MGMLPRGYIVLSAHYNNAHILGVLVAQRLQLDCKILKNARVAELVDALALGASGHCP